jgi:hypothetical protein
LDTAVKTITSLFNDKTKLFMECISNQALLAKLAFGELCSIVIRAEQKIHVCVGERGEEVAMTTAQWLRCMERLPQDIQQRRYGFLSFYFSRAGRKKTIKWRIITAFRSVTHVIGFVVVGVVIVVIAAVVISVGFIAWETFRVVKTLWSFVDRLVELCMPDQLMRE